MKRYGLLDTVIFKKFKASIQFCGYLVCFLKFLLIYCSSCAIAVALKVKVTK